MLPTAYFLLSALALRDVIFFFQAEDGIRDLIVTGVQTCALPIYTSELQSQAEDGIRDLIVTGVQTCRSEERRVEKECRSRWSTYHEKKKSMCRNCLIMITVRR